VFDVGCRIALSLSLPTYPRSSIWCPGPGLYLYLYWVYCILYSTVSQSTVSSTPPARGTRYVCMSVCADRGCGSGRHSLRLRHPVHSHVRHAPRRVRRAHCLWIVDTAEQISTHPARFHWDGKHREKACFSVTVMYVLLRKTDR
jgi:hypothetical protein